MDSVLVVSGTENGRQALTGVLNAREWSRVAAVSTGGEARRALLQTPFDLVVINAPLEDEFGHELAMDLSANFPAGVVLTVKNELAESVALRVEGAGVLVVPKPLNRTVLFQSLRLASAANKRYSSLQKENSRLQKKVRELRVTGRAKCLLVQYRGLTEGEAHRYMEEEAMNLRLPLIDIAEDILKTYEEN